MFRIVTPLTTVNETADGWNRIREAFRLTFVAQCDGYDVWAMEDGESVYVTPLAPLA